MMNILKSPSITMTIIKKSVHLHKAFVVTANTLVVPRYLSTTSATTPAVLKTMETVGIIGLGLMGHGIAQVSAQAVTTKQIIAYEMENKYLLSGKERIQQSLNKLVSKGKMTTDDMTMIQNKITYTTDITELHNTDIIIEAVIEDMKLKQKLYTQLSDVCQASTIFASNTSSLSITEMSQYTNRLSQFVGIHFFNPVQIMKLVEIIQTPYTDPMVYQTVQQYVKDLHKIPVTCQDTPGFIVNRLLVPSLMQAMAMAERRDASIIDIDTSMQYGAGHPMGPLHLADYIGLDTCHSIIQGWVQKYPQESSFFIPNILTTMIQNQQYGRKSGRGFYYWNGDQRGDPVEI